MANCNFYNNQTIDCIEGSTETIEVDLFDVFGRKMATTLSKVTWCMSRYGESESLLNEIWNSSAPEANPNVTVTDNVVQITFYQTGLYGKFIHQLQITDTDTRNYVLDLGQILVKHKIVVTE